MSYQEHQFYKENVFPNLKLLQKKEEVFWIRLGLLAQTTLPLSTSTCLNHGMHPWVSAILMVGALWVLLEKP